MSNESEGPATKFKNKKIPLSPLGERFKEELLSKIVPWEKITDSLEKLPYFTEKHIKSLLTESMGFHLKPNKLRKHLESDRILKNLDHLDSSSGRILLQSFLGTERYMERLVSALAREFQVPLLKFDVDHDYGYMEEDDSDSDDYDRDEKVTFKKGDRVIYNGNTISFDEVNNRTLQSRQRGEVCDVDGDRVAVVFNICSLETKEAERDDKNTETSQNKAIVTWLHGKSLKHCKARFHDPFIAMEALHEVLASQPPMIVYFPDSHLGLPRSSDYSYFGIEKEFVGVVKKKFKQFPEGVALILAHNQWTPQSDEMKEFPASSLRNYIQRLDGPEYLYHHTREMCKLFTNVVRINPPKDQDLVNKFIKQLVEVRLTVISETNLSTIQKVLNANSLSCMNLEQAHFEDMVLTRERVEKIVGWATNHYLSTCDNPCVKEEKLHIPLQSIKLATLRLKKEEPESKKQSYLSLKEDMREVTKPQPMKKSTIIRNLADGYHEKCVFEAVVCSEDIVVKFEDVGALETVKKSLHEAVILPLRRPDLFSHRHLLKPSCRGILLFGPRGTGKTLIAKTLAAESGANFMNVTAAINTPDKKFGETENLTRAIFSYAIKLAPVIVFIDEDDNLLVARGLNKHDTVRLNGFIAAWDGLKSQGVIVVGATNRPYDLDEAVIIRMKRRIYVGLPDVENRVKIVKKLLNKENLKLGFSYEQLAEATEGYSGSDLKNLCGAAACRPIKEFVEQESYVTRAAPVLRPLDFGDFIRSKALVRPSAARDASSIMKMREWKEKYGEKEA